jgi:hypothetical protein
MGIVQKFLIFFSQAAMKCNVMSRVCLSGRCHVTYTGEGEGVYFLTKQTAFVDELGYDFENEFFENRLTFTGFCRQSDLHVFI